MKHEPPPPQAQPPATSIAYEKVFFAGLLPGPVNSQRFPYGECNLTWVKPKGWGISIAVHMDYPDASLPR